MHKVRIATRGSDLALTQSETIASLFLDSGIETSVVTTKSLGDNDRTTPLYSMAGDGVFVSSLNKAVLDGEADLAVHSAKDMPSKLDPDLEVAFYSRRGDPRDYFISSIPIRDFRGIIGTSSIRRKTFISLLNRSVKFTTIRGNIQTRIEKLHEGGVDATVVAKVALDRLGIKPPGFIFSEIELPPDPNQGFIAVISRKGSNLIDFLRKFQDEASLWEASSERLIMAELGLGCSSPVSIRATYDTRKVHFSTVVSGSRVDLDLEFSDPVSIKEAVRRIGDVIA